MTFSLGSTPRSLVKYNDKSIAAITEIATSAKDSMVLIKTLTASGDSTLSFVNGASDVVLDNTYPIYLFKFIQIHPSTESGSPAFSVNFSADTGSNYNVTKTTTTFAAYHKEDDTATLLAYRGDDIAQGTGFQILCTDQGADNDQCFDGELYLFNPSSTTFVKHFFGRSVFQHLNDYAFEFNAAGYCNTTSAVDAVQFKCLNAGNMDSGTLKLYGIKDS